MPRMKILNQFVKGWFFIIISLFSQGHSNRKKALFASPRGHSLALFLSGEYNLLFLAENDDSAEKKEQKPAAYDSDQLLTLEKTCVHLFSTLQLPGAACDLSAQRKQRRNTRRGFQESSRRRRACTGERGTVQKILLCLKRMKTKPAEWEHWSFAVAFVSEAQGAQARPFWGACL